MEMPLRPSGGSPVLPLSLTRLACTVTVELKIARKSLIQVARCATAAGPVRRRRALEESLEYEQALERRRQQGESETVLVERCDGVRVVAIRRRPGRNRGPSDGWRSL